MPAFDRVPYLRCQRRISAHRRFFLYASAGLHVIFVRPLAVWQPEKRTMSDERDLARQERLRAALRENLKRRKSQARGRTDRPVVTPDDDRGPPDGGYSERMVDKAD